MRQENIASRFKAEIKRLGLSFAHVADICGVSKNTAVSWGQGAKIPSEALAVLMRKKGLDVFFVLLGRDQNAPSPVLLDRDELMLIDSYRSLSEAGRDKVRAYLTAALDFEVRTDSAKGVRKKTRANSDS